MTPLDLDDVIDGLRRFIASEVLPRQRAIAGADGRSQIYGTDGRFLPQVITAMREVREVSAQAGFYTMLVPESLGGAGLGFEATFRAWETVYQSCGGTNWIGYHALAHWARGPSHLLVYATEEARASMMDSLLAGTSTLCFALSEPDAGSDLWAMRTRATPTRGGWTVSGMKQWITNAPYADHAVVFAVTDAELLRARKGGITAFLVPVDAPGFAVDSVIEMFGHSGGDEGIVSLDGVFVPDAWVIGDVGDGLRHAMSGVSRGRIYNAARSIGLSRWALDLALAYGEDRRTFGRPILDNQGVAFPLAEAAMQLAAARLLGLDAARRLDGGDGSRLAVSIAKAYATETAVRVLDTAMQVHGAIGFTNELGLSEAWQQARRICVADGSAEMMRRQVAKLLRAGERPWDTA